jgi:hypothetical protein
MPALAEIVIQAMRLEGQHQPHATFAVTARRISLAVIGPRRYDMAQRG